MDTKSFLLGLLTGAAVCAAGFWVAHHGKAPTAAAAKTEQARANSGVASPPEVAAEEARKSGKQAAAAAVPELEARDLNRSLAASDISQLPVPVSGDAADPAAEEEITNPERAARKKEPKDLAWSYNMEQALQQFLAGHKEGSKFYIRGIDCRTSFCEIESVAFDKSAWPAWTQIMHDLKEQPWAGFVSEGSSAEPRNGRFVIVGTLWRTQPPAP